MCCYRRRGSELGVHGFLGAEETHSVMVLLVSADFDNVRVVTVCPADGSCTAEVLAGYQDMSGGA